MDEHRVTLDGHILIRRTLILDCLKAIVAVQGRKGQALTHLLFLRRMDLRGLIRIDEVVDAHQRAVGNDLCSLPLLFTQQGSADGIVVVVIPVRCYLNEIEGDLTQAELRAPLVNQQLHPLRVLIAGITHVRTALIVEDALHRKVQDGVERAVAPKQRTVIVPLCPLLADLHRVGGITGIFLQILLRQPALYARTSFISFDNTNWDVERTTQQPGEEIACGRELTDSLRRTLAPLTLGIILRRGPHDAGNLHAADTFRLGGIQHMVVVAFHRTHAETLYRHLHVRLSGTDPHLTADDIVDRHRLTVVERDAQRLVTGLRCPDLHQPTTILASLGRHLLVAPRGGDSDRLTRLGPTPEAGICFLL